MRNRTPSDLPTLVSGYLDQHLIRDRGLSLRTREVYADSLMLFLNFASKIENKDADKLVFGDLCPETVLSFLDHLEKDRGNTARSRNLRLSAIKSFAGYAGFKNVALLEQVAQLKLIPGKKHDKGHVDYLNEEEVFAVLRAPDVTTPSGLRDRAMLLITYVYGLRVSEALNLSLADLWLGREPTLNILGKGGKRDSMPLLHEHVEALNAWLRVRPSVSSQKVFLSRTGDPLTRDGFAYILSKHAKAASFAVPSIKNRRVTPHVLRHSCAMAVLKATKDPRKAARLLRHVGYATIEVYLHADPDEKLDTITRHPALGIKRGDFGDRGPRVLEMLKAAREGKDHPIA